MTVDFFHVDQDHRLPGKGRRRRILHTRSHVICWKPAGLSISQLSHLRRKHRKRIDQRQEYVQVRLVGSHVYDSSCWGSISGPDRVTARRRNKSVGAWDAMNRNGEMRFEQRLITEAYRSATVYTSCGRVNQS